MSKVECPVCARPFAAAEIERHADGCVSQSERQKQVRRDRHLAVRLNKKLLLEEELVQGKTPAPVYQGQPRKPVYHPLLRIDDDEEEDDEESKIEQRARLQSASSTAGRELRVARSTSSPESGNGSGNGSGSTPAILPRSIKQQQQFYKVLPRSLARLLAC